MRTSYLIPGLTALFLVVAVGWFFVSPDESDNRSGSSGLSTAASGSGSVGKTSSLGTARVPFQTSHEVESTLTPSGENVAATFHMEIEILKKQLEEAPRDTTALLKIARLTQDAHQMDEAVGYYERYLELVPIGRQARLDLTQCLGELQQWDDALALSHESLELLPDDPGITYNLGAVYANTGKYDEARSAWLSVSTQEVDPDMKAKAESALTRLDMMAK